MHIRSLIALGTLSSLLNAAQLCAADEWALAVLQQLSAESKSASKPSERLNDLKLWNEFLEKTDFSSAYPQLFGQADKDTIEKFKASAKNNLSTIIQQFNTIKKFKSALETARGKNLEDLATFFDTTLAPKIEFKRTAPGVGATTTTRITKIPQSPLNDAELATMLNNEYPETAKNLADTINSYVAVQQQYESAPRTMLIGLLVKAKTVALFDESTRKKFEDAYKDVVAYQQKQR
jgi:hypothetical protein